MNPEPSFSIQPAGHWLRVEPLSASDQESLHSKGEIVLAGSQGGPIGLYRVVARGPGMFHAESRQYIPLSTEVGTIVMVEETHLKTQHVGRVKVQLCAAQHVLATVVIASENGPTPYS